METTKKILKTEQEVNARFVTFAEHLPEFMAISGTFSEFLALIKASNISGAVSAALKQAGHISVKKGKVTINDPLKTLIEQRAFAAVASLIRRSVRAYRQSIHILSQEEQPAPRIQGVVLSNGTAQTLFRSGGELPERLTLDPKEIQRNIEFQVSSTVGDAILAACHKYKITPSDLLEKIVRDYFNLPTVPTTYR
jgi:hypothetical protein